MMILQQFMRLKIKTIHGGGIKILTPKEMLQSLPIAHAYIKADNTSENLPNEFPQIIYSLYQGEEITKKVYKNMMIPTQL